MTKFIELHYKGCEICLNFDHIKRFSPVADGKKTNITDLDNSSVIVDESYDTVKAKILNRDNPKEI